MSDLNRLFKRSLVIAVLMTMTLVPMASMAQDEPAENEETQSQQQWGRGGQRGDRPGGERWRDRRQFDPEQMRARFAERLKETLEVQDDEWKVIEPLLTDVFEKQREARWGGLRGMFGRRSERPGPEESSGDPAVDALQKALDSKETSPDEIKSKLKSLRESRKENERELQMAREKLRKVLTVRQEAQLVLMGILD